MRREWTIDTFPGNSLLVGKIRNNYMCELASQGTITKPDDK